MPGFCARAWRAEPASVNTKLGARLSLHVRAPHGVHRRFTSTGGDDLSVFVNGRLGIDLGGLHPEVSQSIDRDGGGRAVRPRGGKTHPLDPFHARRHTNASHFRVETSFL